MHLYLITMSERSSKESKTLEVLLFNGSDSDSEDDYLHDSVSSNIPRFTLTDVARHDSKTYLSLPLNSVRPISNLAPNGASGYEGMAELSEDSSNASTRYSAMSNRSSNPAKKVRRMGSVLMLPPSDMYTRTDMQPRRTCTFKKRKQLTPAIDRRDKKERHSCHQRV
jgi:hypothetical protein